MLFFGTLCVHDVSIGVIISIYCIYHHELHDIHNSTDLEPLAWEANGIECVTHIYNADGHTLADRS